MIRIIITLFCLLVTGGIYGQENFTISGYIKDAASGETLIGASVQAEGGEGLGTLTNDYGFFSLTLPGGNYRIVIAVLGYGEQVFPVNLDKHIRLDVNLEQGSSRIEEVVISSQAENKNVTSARMGVEQIAVSELNKLPVLFGEKDIIKSLTLLPGVKTAGEGNGGFFVRGGAADQNLILLDEAIVYNPSHLLGFFSTFNSDAIKNVTLYKGNMPAQFGGRLSSVMDVRMNDGSNQDFHVNGGLGLISSRLSIEGPVVRNKGSFLVSARRTYADVFLKLSSDSTVKNNTLYFYDINAKASYQLGEKDRIFFSGYFGNDKLGINDLFGLDWGNSTGTFRWNHQFGPKLFSNTSLIYSDYKYDIKVDLASFTGKIHSRIRDWTLKEELSFYPNVANEVKIGFSSIYHTIKPGTYSGDVTLVSQPFNHTWENAVYVNNTWKATGRLNVDYGIRLSAFSVLGGDNKFYTLNENREITDTLSYGRGTFVKTYINPEPRVAASYRISETSAIKAAYSRNAQYLHLISNSGAGNPTDKWVPSNNIIKPEISDIVSAGYARNFMNNMYAFSFEAYYKYMQHQIDYEDGANVFSSEPIETQLLFGHGRAYGAEVLLRKNKGRLTGWIGYTLSRTEKQIPGINNGEWYVARQDRTHDLAIVAIYELSRKWTVSGTFVYYTGNAVSFPSGKYYMDNQVIFLYTERNGYRMPAYHRMDLSATLKLGSGKRRFSSELAFGLYNVYGRENAYVITFRENPEDRTRTQALQTALFRFVPSVTYNFKF